MIYISGGMGFILCIICFMGVYGLAIGEQTPLEVFKTLFGGLGGMFALLVYMEELDDLNKEKRGLRKWE